MRAANYRNYRLHWG